MHVSEFEKLYKLLNMEKVKDCKHYEELLQDHFGEFMTVNLTDIVPHLVKSGCLT